MLKHLRDDAECEFKILVDICGVDWPQREKRFDVVYHLLSLTRNMRIRVKAQVGEGETIKSCDRASIPPPAGSSAKPSTCMASPSRTIPICAASSPITAFPAIRCARTFPLTGYVELRYDDELKRVVYQPVQLVQEFRDFDFMSPWEGAPHILPGDEKAAMAPNATSGDPGKKP